MQRYENDYFNYVRKPHSIPSTFGSEESFLHKLVKDNSPYIIKLQEARHWIDRELWLVNRLDNVTGGLLFFAKNPAIHSDYKLLQQEHRVEKIYYADLYGNCYHTTMPQSNNAADREEKNTAMQHWSAETLRHWSIIIDTPIYHHKTNESKMTTDIKSSRWKANQVQTLIQPIEYNKEENYTTCKIVINKGIRHQIRLHAASIWHHIIGDILYCPKDLKTRYKGDKVNLRSVGIEI